MSEEVIKEDTILALSHTHKFTNASADPIKHTHRPYFLIKYDEKPLVRVDGVKEIGPVETYKSYVNWNKELKVRRVYVDKPGITPRVSGEYYKQGKETYEQGIPYLQRVYADHCAEGHWPLNTKGKKETISCLIYDIEQVNNIITCCGIATFNIYITSNVDLANEVFDIDFSIDDKIEIKQLLADNINEEHNNIIKPLIDDFKSSSIKIGHNILQYDNAEVLKRLTNISQFGAYIRDSTSKHKFFNRGRMSNLTEIYPISFDTLLASRFLFKEFAEGQYGLKRLTRLLDIRVEDTKQFPYRKSRVEQIVGSNRRIYESDFGGFGRWSNDNQLCLQYNEDDLWETYGLFKKIYKEVFTYMFLIGAPFSDIVANSNTKNADYMSLIRAYKKEITAPMIEPIKAAKILAQHFGEFDGESLTNYKLPTKSEIFEYFRTHKCTTECFDWYFASKKKKTKKTNDGEDDDEALGDASDDIDRQKIIDDMANKVLRCTKYGDEMPEWVEFYPILLDYLTIGGMGYEPEQAGIVNTPLHQVRKADVAAQYPSIVKAKNITYNTVRLARKGEKPDGWLCLRLLKHRELLPIFEWRKVTADDKYIDRQDVYKNQVLIGYINRGVEGYINKGLTGLMRMATKYKKLPEWKTVYDKAIKPARNAMTHGILLSLNATSTQFNIAGAAIPTLGQEISVDAIATIRSNGYKLVEADTDGHEYISLENSADFETVVRNIETKWQGILNYPDFKFDIELYDHKVFVAEKNYVTIDKGKVKLTGATFKASDKAMLEQDIMKAIMLKILPDSSTREEFMSKLLEGTLAIINDKFKTITHESYDDMVLKESISPPSKYDDGSSHQKRALAIERITEQKLLFPTKLELIVCKDPLPGISPEFKNVSKPIEYMWPRELVEDKGLGGGIDIDWYRRAVISYIDNAFGLQKVSVGQPMRSLFAYDSGEAPTPSSTPSTPLSTTPKPKIYMKKIHPKQSRLA